MQFEIVHHTRYRYSRLVFLDPHVLRFRPRQDGAQLVEDFQLHIYPVPAGSTEYQDSDRRGKRRLTFSALPLEIVV